MPLTGGTITGALTVSGNVSIADKIIHTGDTNTAIRFPAADTVTVETNGSERLRVNSSGDVGIGTTSPNGKFTTVGTYATVTHSLAANDAISISSIGVNSSNFNAFTIGQGNSLNNSAVMRFKYNGAGSTSNYAGFGFYANDDILNIRADGNVGIGTSSPSQKLTVVNGYGIFEGIKVGQNGTDIDSTFLGASSLLALKINGSEKMRIISSGNVGIGVTAPVGKLQVAGDILPSADNTGVIGNTNYTWSDGQFTNLSVNSTLNVRAAIDLADADVLRFGSSDDFKMYYDGSANEMEFEMEAACNQIRVHDDGTTRFTLGRSTGDFSASGSVYCRSATITKNDTFGPGINIVFSGSTTTGMMIRNNTGVTKSAIDFTYSDAAQPARGSIVVSSTSVAYNTTSDYRAKENVVPMMGAIDRVSLLKPVRFSFIGDDRVVDGFLAHEAQEVVSEAVTGSKDAVDYEGNPEYQGIDQSKLVPLLTAALQEAVAKIESLEQRILTLENK